MLPGRKKCYLTSQILQQKFQEMDKEQKLPPQRSNPTLSCSNFHTKYCNLRPPLYPIQSYLIMYIETIHQEMQQQRN